MPKEKQKTVKLNPGRKEKKKHPSFMMIEERKETVERGKKTRKQKKLVNWGKTTYRGF